MVPRLTRRRGPALAAALPALLVLAACTSETFPPTPLGSTTPTPPIASRTPGASPTPVASGPTPTAATPFDPSRVNLVLREVVGGLTAPLFVTGSGDGSGRLLVLEQAGRIMVVGADGRLRSDPFLDIRGRVASGGERGLLGLALHPAYAQNGRLFLDYTDTSGDTVIAEYARRDADHADAASERVLLHIKQPFANHNGGMVAFGPDGMLYIGMGDGGSGGDPLNNGQRLDTLLGKLLRIDVDDAQPYAIPADNPFVGRTGVRPEIFAYGLRNPWRFSFDRATGDLFIGDVGQGAWEEVDAVPAGRAGGLDFGWRIMEGRDCFGGAACSPAGLARPAFVYSHSFGCAISGGYVYRGTAFPALAGGYLFGDYCSGRIWALSAAAALSGATTARELLDTGLTVASFGQDDAGELYVCDLGGGRIYRLTAEAR